MHWLNVEKVARSILPICPISEFRDMIITALDGQQKTWPMSWFNVYFFILTNSFGQWLCGLVGRAVASDTRSPRFESSHWQKIIYILNICLLSTVY